MENVKPSVLVSLAAIEPAPPALLPDGSIRIDALSRLSTLEHSSLLADQAPMIAQSAHVVGGNQIRQMGTLGGNLCQEIRCLQLDQRHDYQFVAPCYKRGGDCCYPYPRNAPDTCWSVYMSDVAPALIALDAQVEIIGAAGTRRVPIEELFTGNGLKPTRLGRAELVRAVTVPRRRLVWLGLPEVHGAGAELAWPWRWRCSWKRTARPRQRAYRRRRGEEQPIRPAAERGLRAMARRIAGEDRGRGKQEVNRCRITVSPGDI